MHIIPEMIQPVNGAKLFASNKSSAKASHQALDDRVGLLGLMLADQKSTTDKEMNDKACARKWQPIR
jgi:hypothetical protein